MGKYKEVIPLFKVFMSDTAKEEVGKVLDSGYIGQGIKVDEFEDKLRNYFNYDYITTLNSGTSGLHLALHLLKKQQKVITQIPTHGEVPVINTIQDYPGIQPGDEVLATSMTCTASNWPILANGLKIKWVDIDRTTLNMDLDDLARKISPKTKAIIGVHWGGYPLDLDKIEEITNQASYDIGFKPQLIEDCAHAFGSKYNGKLIGTHGNISMFSLQAIKHLTSIDGGLLLSPNNEFYQRAKLTRWYGIDRDSNRKDFRCEANIPEWGFKFHMNDVNATVGMENLNHVDWIIKKHKDNANYYDTELKNVKGITLLERKDGYESSFWIYSMLVDNRDDFYKWMKECNIMVSQVHERNDKHTCVSEFKTQLPTLDNTIGKIVSIPVGWWVTEEQREYIVDCIKKWK